MKSISQYCLLALSALMIISCQREIGFNDPVNGADSTQLVKSIQLIYNTGGAHQDSITESYSYDEGNHTITVSWQTLNPFYDDWNGSNAVYSYNTQGLLTGITFHYRNTYTPADGDYTSISISYDAEDVLKQVVLHYAGWPAVTKNYTKTQVGTGYKLEWNNVITNPGFLLDPGKQTELFDANGKCLKYEAVSYVTAPNGTVSTVIDFSDSLVYSTAGDLQKVYNWEPQRIAPQPNYQILRYEFESRYDKGNQLGKQRQLLFKGLHNMELDEADDWFYTGILNDTPNPYEFDQYTGRPFITAKVYNIDNNIQVPFTSDAVFDNLDRLVSFKSYFDDTPLVPMLYKLSYYK